MAKSAAAHSYRVLLMIATRSPSPIPEAIRALARLRTSARNASFVMSIQVPDDGEQNATLCGWLAALRTGRSERLPPTRGVTSGGTEMSFMKRP